MAKWHSKELPDGSDDGAGGYIIPVGFPELVQDIIAAHPHSVCVEVGPYYCIELHSGRENG